MKATVSQNNADTRVRPHIFKTKKFKDNVFVICLLAWPVLHFLVFWLYVNARNILLVFQRYNIFTGEYEWYGFKRFADIFQKMILGGDVTLNNAFWNSVFSIVINLLVILPLAFFSAYTFYKKVPAEKYFRVMFFLPSIISSVVLTMSYKYMFHSDFGPMAQLIEKLFGYAPDYFATTQESKTIWPMIYIYCVWAGLGSNVILISGAMLRIPKEITESARIDGVGFWREMGGIVLPLIMPTLSNYIIIGVLGMFSFMMQPMLIAGEGGGEQGHTLTVALHVFNLVNGGTESSSIQAATIGLVMCVVGAPFVYLTKFITGKLTPDVDY